MHSSWLPIGMGSSTRSHALLRSERKNFLEIFKGILQSIFQIGKPLIFTELNTVFRKRTYKNYKMDNEGICFQTFYIKLLGCSSKTKHKRDKKNTTHKKNPNFQLFCLEAVCTCFMEFSIWERFECMHFQILVKLWFSHRMTGRKWEWHFGNRLTVTRTAEVKMNKAYWFEIHVLWEKGKLLLINVISVVYAWFSTL